MSDSDLLPFGASIASDVLAAFSLPGGAVLTTVATSYIAKRRRNAAEILIKEIASGKHGPINFDEHDVEPLIDVILRFSKAVDEGAARENLVLLAQVIAGLKRNRALDTDHFRRWCAILEHLSRDQLVTIGLAYRADREIGDPYKIADEFDPLLRRLMDKAGYDRLEIEPLLTTVASAGLLASASAYGGLAYRPTPWLLELGKLANLEFSKSAASS